jgi:hypothetical protein|tara:strand:+ start:12235 stop:12471 length:237 start_codon:yes stop_codon:yes gene_type:complete
MATTPLQEYQTIATTGTAVALSGAQEVLTLCLYAPLSNEFAICIGSSTVTANNSSTDGLLLKPGRKTPNIGPVDLADI